MTDAVILSAVRTAIGTAYKGTLAYTPAYDLAQTVLSASVERSGVNPNLIDDVILAESGWGGGDIARYAAVSAGLTAIPGQAVNRHCAGSLTAIGNAAAAVKAGMDMAVIAGGVQSSSTAPKLTWHVPGSSDEYVENWMSPSHPDRPDAPNQDMTITVGWNTAVAEGISRAEMDAWAFRSHQRAVAAIDAGRFDDEIVPVKAFQKDDSSVVFGADEHPRRTTSLERLSTLAPLHPEIEGFSITAGNSSGINDAASALVITSSDFADVYGLQPLAKIRAWASIGVDPADTGRSVLDVIPKVLARAGVYIDDITLWEINEAFASVPVAAVRKFGIDESLVNTVGSGCSLGHPVAASGARMVTTLTHELRRCGGGIGLAAMCAGGGQGGAVIVEVD